MIWISAPMLNMISKKEFGPTVFIWILETLCENGNKSLECSGIIWITFYRYSHINQSLYIFKFAFGIKQLQLDLLELYLLPIRRKDGINALTAQKFQLLHTLKLSMNAMASIQLFSPTGQRYSEWRSFYLSFDAALNRLNSIHRIRYLRMTLQISWITMQTQPKMTMIELTFGLEQGNQIILRSWTKMVIIFPRVIFCKNLDLMHMSREIYFLRRSYWRKISHWEHWTISRIAYAYAKQQIFQSGL